MLLVKVLTNYKYQYNVNQQKVVFWYFYCLEIKT